MIICAGEALIDFVPEAPVSGETDLPDWKPVAGGSPFNCAIAAARLGAAVQFAGAISTDLFGAHLVDRLRSENVGLELVQRIDLPSTLAFVKRDSAGIPTYAFYAHSAADRAFSLAEFPPSLPEGALLQFGSISLIADPAGSAILDLTERESRRRLLAFDPNVRASLVVDEADYRERLARALRAATILKTSDEDLDWIFPGLSQDEAARRAMEFGAEVVVVTRGADGPVAYLGDEKTAVPAVPVTVADTIGAGDSFLAATLVWLDEHGVTTRERARKLSTEELSDVLQFATRVAALTCSRMGADPPRRAELE
jgi:fructokinase